MGTVLVVKRLGRPLVAMFAASALVTGVGVSPALAFNPTPEPPFLNPVDGAHWEPFVGLPDSFGPMNMALVSSVDEAGMPRIATISGLRGHPTSVLGTLTFAVRTLPGGINPCWDVAYTNPNGSHGDLMVNPLTRSDFVTGDPPEPIRGTDYTKYSFHPRLPAGSTIDTVTIGVDVTTDPPEPVRVFFDNIGAAGHTWTWAGSNAGL